MKKILTLFVVGALAISAFSAGPGVKKTAKMVAKTPAGVYHGTKTTAKKVVFGAKQIHQGKQIIKHPVPGGPTAAKGGQKIDVGRKSIRHAVPEGARTAKRHITH